MKFKKIAQSYYQTSIKKENDIIEIDVFLSDNNEWLGEVVIKNQYGDIKYSSIDFAENTKRNVIEQIKMAIKLKEY